MRLTNTLRTAFVRAVVDDIPRPPEVRTLEDIRPLVQADLERDVPIEIKSMVNNPALSGYINYTSYSLRDWNWASVSYICERRDSATLSDEFARFLATQQEINEAFEAKKEAMHEKLMAVAMGCTTLKKLKEALPELEKYMPAETTTVANVPALTGIADELRSMGVSC